MLAGLKYAAEASRVEPTIAPCIALPRAETSLRAKPPAIAVEAEATERAATAATRTLFAFITNSSK